MSEAIVFTSGKGGVGKTTVISNIGVELSQLDKKVIMLDTDMGASQSGPGNGNRGQGQLQYPRHLKPLMPYQTGNHTQ